MSQTTEPRNRSSSASATTSARRTANGGTTTSAGVAAVAAADVAATASPDGTASAADAAASRRTRRADAPPRAGIVVTGTELVSGAVSDRNGPWISERLRGVGVDVAHILIVGDRVDDMDAALRFMTAEGLDLIVTSGGLGPTADDRTAAVVAAAQRRPLALDRALEGRIAVILRRLSARMPHLDGAAIAAGNAKQAMVPAGATILEPIGTAPGLVVPPPPGADSPVVVVLPGPPRELRPMWPAALEAAPMRAVLARAALRIDAMLRLFGLPESEIAQTLRVAAAEGVQLERLEITTCQRHGESEIATRYAPVDADAYAALLDVVRRRHPRELYSEDGSTVDEQIFALLSERHLTVATAESCTGGLLAGRLTDPAGASGHVRGGVVTYANAAKVELAGVPAELIERHGAVSEEVARALAEGARGRFDADLGIGVTGIAGPGGGSAEKPVGLVWISVVGAGEPLTRSVQLPGSRADVRERTTTVALHLLRRAVSAAPAR